MTSFYNTWAQKNRRRSLRNQPIPSEVVTWSLLRGRRLLGCKFRRQYGIGPYIIDFYCPSIRLAVEIDGETHFRPGQDVKDTARQQWIEQQGITFVRLTSDEVMGNLDGVVQKLEMEIKQLVERMPTSPER